MQRKKRLFFISTLLLLSIVLAPLQGANAASLGEVTNNEAIFNFPESITLRATIESDSPITSVVLEYGDAQLSCGTVIAKAYPQFTSAKTVDVEWVWEMRQSGSLPPGTELWWRWRYVNEAGEEKVSETKTTVWLDQQHDWQTRTSDYINLHWYAGDTDFAQELLDAAEGALTLLENDAGLTPNSSIDLYIYGDTDDMRDAILYEPGWTGGVAYSDYDIVLIGIAESDLDWGRDTIAHELTHVLVGHLTFSCLGDVPTWLNEGLAVYSEGELDKNSARQLNDAINNNELLSVRSLSGGFSEVPSRAYLSYSQSYSIVKFLIETYGRDDMNSLLTTLRDGTTIDDALQKIYGFNVEGLESEWRQAIGAAPTLASAQPTAQPTPTYVPTYVPYAGVPMLVTPTAYNIPESTGGDGADPGSGGIPDLGGNDENRVMGVVLVSLCCCLLLVVLVIGAVWYFVSRQKNKGGQNEIS